MRRIKQKPSPSKPAEGQKDTLISLTYGTGRIIGLKTEQIVGFNPKAGRRLQVLGLRSASFELFKDSHFDGVFGLSPKSNVRRLGVSSVWSQWFGADAAGAVSGGGGGDRRVPDRPTERRKGEDAEGQAQMAGFGPQEVAFQIRMNRDTDKDGKSKHEGQSFAYLGSRREYDVDGLYDIKYEFLSKQAEDAWIVDLSDILIDGVSINLCPGGCAALLDSGTSLILGPKGALGAEDLNNYLDIHSDCSNQDSLPKVT